MNKKVDQTRTKIIFKISMFKKLLLISIFCPFIVAECFFDIQNSDPQYEIFQHLNDTGVMSGFQDGNFYPEKIITRAEAVVISLRAGQKLPNGEFTGTTPFSDVDPNAWFAPYVSHATKIGVISRHSEFFRPNQAVSKAEFLAFLFRSTKVNFDRYYTRTKNIAIDIPQDAWFAPHFAHAKKYQIAHLPADGLYKPNESLSRRRAAMITFRQLKLFHGNNVTQNFVELNAKISQFITLLRAGETEKAEFHLQRIIELTDSLSRTKNDENAVAMAAISRSMKHFSESLRAFKFGRTLTALESLHLSEKHARRASEKSDSVKEFSTELSSLISETLTHFATKSLYVAK